MLSKLRMALVFFIVMGMSVPAHPQTEGTAAPGPAEGGAPDLLFILDVSGSMMGQIEGEPQIVWARKAIKGAVAALPADAEVGLRTYGDRIPKANKTESCRDTELKVNIGAGNASKISQMVDLVEPKGWTPIAYSLELAAGDFAGRAGQEHTIILVSDGEETCGGDPMAAARALVQKGFKLKICTVGFNVNEIARQQLKALAEQFGCTYTDVRSGVSLEKELTELTKRSFLIEKKKVENRIRGGDSFALAVPIEFGRKYKLDHHQRMGDTDYFKFELEPGQTAVVHVEPTPFCIKITGDKVEESEKSWCSPEAYSFTIYDSAKKELISLGTGSTEKVGTSKPVEAAGEQSSIYYLGVGSQKADMHKDNEFMLIAESFGDAGGEMDAGGTFSKALPIQPGLYERNRLSKADKVDIFKVDIPAGKTLKVAANALEGPREPEVVLDAVGELGEVKAKGKYHFRVGESQSIALEPSSNPETVYIRVQFNPKWQYYGTVYYSLGVSVK